MSIPFMVLLIPVRSQIINKKQNPFEINGFFMTMSIASLFVALLATVKISISLTWMRDIHCAILKAIGCFSAILAPFSLLMVLYVPHELNWIGYILVCVIVGIVVAFYFYFTQEEDLSFFYIFEDALQPEKNKTNNFPIIYYIGFLVPISLLVVLFAPHNLNWAVPPMVFLFFVIVAVYMTFVLLPVVIKSIRGLFK